MSHPRSISAAGHTENVGSRAVPPPAGGRFHSLTAARVQQLAVRLIHGEVIDYVDERRRRWRGTNASLLFAQPDTVEMSPVIEGSDAYTVAFRLADIEVGDLEA